MPIVARPLFERAHEALIGLQERLPGRGVAAGDSSVSQVAASGGTRGMGAAALAKALAICAGTAGSAAICVTAGVIPAPIALTPHHTVRPHLERIAAPPVREAGIEQEDPPVPAPAPEPEAPAPPPEQAQEQPAPELAPSAEAVATEVTSTPTPEPPSVPAPTQASTGSPAGEFGP